MKRLGLFFVVFLLISSVAIADYLPTVREVENGCPGLETYIVGLTIDDEGALQVIADLEIASGAHQLTVLGEATPTHDGVIAPLLGEYSLLDTYFFSQALAIHGSYTHSYGSGYTETNDGSDPCDIVVANDFVDSAGFGGFFAAEPYSLAGNVTSIYETPEDLKGFEFMQIVVAAGTQATVTGSYATVLMCELDQKFPSFSITVGVPEPSMMILSILGGIYLLGIRFVKKLGPFAS